MFDHVWSKVVDGSYDRCAGILQGYDRKGIQDEVYPVIFPSSMESQVQGIVYLDVAAYDLVKLDQFEGEHFFRKTEQVLAPDMTLLPAEVYILKEEYYTFISPKEWDPVHFSTTGIQFFIHNYMDTDKQ
jgi:hypothetical protein